MHEIIGVLVKEIENRYFEGLSFEKAYESVIKDIKRDSRSYLIYKCTLIIP
ncbi:MAG: hypothetical protein ACRCVJ_01175 [Clostridium sp.]|uniref:hypothetical protein n=1 Tax=Clostridium sp. TaxID=1506 RepID=UPI003F3CACC2